MSRIHEALKKAEQERAASQGGPAAARFPPSTRLLRRRSYPMPVTEKLPVAVAAQECPRAAASPRLQRCRRSPVPSALMPCWRAAPQLHVAAGREDDAVFQR